MNTSNIFPRPAAANLGAGGDGNDLASVQFRRFVARLRQEVAQAASLAATDGQLGAEKISRALCQLIEEQTLEAARQGGKAGVDTEMQARFLKAALADEILLHTKWAGRTWWRHVLIEATLFRSGQAGQQVFADLDQLLREREPARRGVARLYLYMLSLGFQGRYRGQDEQEKIAAYRSELFRFVYQREPGLRARDAVLTDQPYASTLSYSAARRVSTLVRGGGSMLAALLLVLALSEILWLWQSWPVRKALAELTVHASAAQASCKTQGATPC
ncbi:MAG TPA: DotU family type IV/VI secretion system protein [Telluria sp.]|jgi:type VI secretion system protein ImpK